MRTNKRGGCSVNVWFRNRVDGCLGQIRVTSKPGLVGQEALDPVTDECASKIERQAREVYAAIGTLLQGEKA